MRRWHYVQHGDKVGPVSEEELARLFLSRVLEPDTLVWEPGLEDWVSAASVPGLVPKDRAILPPPLPAEGTVRLVQPLYAGFWKRLVAKVIDQFMLGIAGLFIGGLFGGIGLLLVGGAEYESKSVGDTVELVGFLTGIVLNWLYFTLFESSSYQTTPGKLAIGIKVTDLEGRRISFARANGRYWGKIVSGIIFLIGYIMAGFTERKQALHDIMAGCLVVNR